ncbi:hypothetical protein LCGC14_1253940 [marine sediment metagenome]|uniref:Uncharacterized protein n=1 Tax=marine sediment metagenome TaxID=412755 RepID=A0A0F9NJA0_9ZZZZ
MKKLLFLLMFLSTVACGQQFHWPWPTNLRLAVYALNHYAQVRHIAPNVPSYQLWAIDKASLIRVEAAARRVSPDAMFKSYMSVAKVQPTKQNVAYPHSIGFDRLDDSDWYTVDNRHFWLRLGQAATARKVQDWIVPEIIRRGWSLVHFNNVVPPWAWSGAQPWPVQMTHVRALTQRLNVASIRTEVNTATVPGLMTDEQIQLLTVSANGFTFEMAWHRNILKRRTRIERQLVIYRRWLGQDKAVGWHIVLDPTKVSSSRTRLDVQDAEARFLAALAMCVREPGDFLWVGARFYRITHDEKWSRWVEDAGVALGPWEMPNAVDPPATISRRYTNGIIVASFVLRDGWFFPRKN